MAETVEYRQCDSRNYTPGRQGCAVSWMVVHYTATDASAHNNLLYFSRSSAGASAHYFIDKDGSRRQSVLERDTAWHASNWAMNLRSIGVEVVSAGEDFTEAQIRALSELYAELKARYGIAEDHVIRHYDVNGKLCPAPYVDAGKWAELRSRIVGSSGSCSGGGPSVEGDVGELARRVINGDFGNGDDRRAALGDRYDEVQAEVNRILNGGAASGDSGGPDIEALALAVIDGDYGNGEERRQRLGDLYDEVQRRVNELLS